MVGGLIKLLLARLAESLRQRHGSFDGTRNARMVGRVRPMCSSQHREYSSSSTTHATLGLQVLIEMQQSIVAEKSILSLISHPSGRTKYLRLLALKVNHHATVQTIRRGRLTSQFACWPSSSRRQSEILFSSSVLYESPHAHAQLCKRRCLQYGADGCP